MTTALYFENTQTGKRFRVVHFDKEKGIITLEGKYAKFTEPYNKELFEKLGYKLVKEEQAA